MASDFRFDGKRIEAHEGDTLASALHRRGVKVLGRSMKYHRPRGLFCNAGSCASCYVEVDGVPNLPACMQPAAGVSTVRSQNRLGSAKRDLLRVVDDVYPEGFDPHGAFTRPGVLNRAFVRAVRLMSGWGRAPKPGTGKPLSGKRYQHQVDELIIGAGDHGLARAAKANGDVLIVDEASQPGGDARWLGEPPATPRARLWCDAIAFGIYEDTVAIRRGTDLHEVRAGRVTIATGHHDPVPLFENNDLPGILSERGATRLLGEHGVLPGRRIAVHGSLSRPLADALTSAGASIVASGTVTAAHGRRQVSAATVDGQRVRADTIITTGPGIQRLELLQQAGCDIGWDNGPAVVRGADGATSRPDVFAHFAEGA